MVKLLLVEDDQNLGMVISDNLQVEGYQVTWAKDGAEALDVFSQKDFDICLLDVMLPKKDGFAVAGEIRKSDHMVPILFLTAKSMEEDRLKGFQTGGDDYITKPFSMKELIYRIEVFLKRSRQTPKDHSKRYELGSSSFDFDNLELTVGEEEHTLTEKEAMVLKMLCEHKGRVLKREEILEQVWGTNDYFLGRSMDVFISKLRKYLKADPSVKISNIHGVGFKLE